MIWYLIHVNNITACCFRGSALVQSPTWWGSQLVCLLVFVDGLKLAYRKPSTHVALVWHVPSVWHITESVKDVRGCPRRAWGIIHIVPYRHLTRLNSYGFVFCGGRFVRYIIVVPNEIPTVPWSVHILHLHSIVPVNFFFIPQALLLSLF